MILNFDNIPNYDIFDGKSFLLETDAGGYNSRRLLNNYFEGFT
jgi:hypothetical protein